MNQRTYPYNAWVLTPQCKLKEVVLVEQAYAHYPDWDRSATGSVLHVEKLHLTKEAAIKAGWEKVYAAEDRISKLLATVTKQRISLEKAAQP